MMRPSSDLSGSPAESEAGRRDFLAFGTCRADWFEPSSLRLVIHALDDLASGEERRPSRPVDPLAPGPRRVRKEVDVGCCATGGVGVPGRRLEEHGRVRRESRPARGTGPTRCYIVPSATSRRLRSAGLLIRAITAAGRSIDIVAQPKERRYARAASHNVMSVRITRMTPVARRTVRIENRFSTPRPPTAARAATVQSARMAPTATLNAEP